MIGIIIILILPVTPPSQRVQFLLGDQDGDTEHESHPLFSEMEELFMGENGEQEWKETARWIKHMWYFQERPIDRAERPELKFGMS